ncbi:MAG: amino acid ABC transporter substrate-binding protein [Leptospirales bacterium]|nr:amino acid ABC transporter substrate-binding protein [Leptospirales bacterium]
MKGKTIKLLCLLFAVVFLASGCGKKKAGDNSLEQIKAKGFFIVGLDDQFPPMGFRGQDNKEVVGFDIDLAKETAKKLGIEVKFQAVAWNGIISSLNKGDIDVVWNGMTINEERKKNIEFSKPYLNNRQIVMVLADSAITTIEMLKGKTVGLQQGSTSEIALKNKPDIEKSLKETRQYDDNNKALMDLSAKRIDAVVVDEIVGRWSMAKKPGVYKVLAEDMGTELYGVGIRKDDLTFKDALDKALDEVKKDKAGADISKKWFGEDILIK